jgi:hypothetical protein
LRAEGLTGDGGDALEAAVFLAVSVVPTPLAERAVR